MLFIGSKLADEFSNLAMHEYPQKLIDLARLSNTSMVTIFCTLLGPLCVTEAQVQSEFSYNSIHELCL